MAHLTVKFDSLGDYLKAAARPTAAEGYNLSRSEYDASWSGTATLEAALTLARDGWPEGRKSLMAATAAAATSPTFSPQIMMDVAGAYPIPALAAAGDPDCMVNLSPVEDRVRPIVRLLVMIGASSAYKANEFLSYGAAVLSYIDALEAAAYRVEITVCYTGHNMGNAFGIQIVVKQAEEPLEIDRMAFAMTHVAFLRRVMFAVAESEPSISAVMGHGYGTPRNPDERDTEPGQIILPGVNMVKPGHACLKSPSAALAQIAPMIEEQLRGIGVEPPALAFAGTAK